MAVKKTKGKTAKKERKLRKLKYWFAMDGGESGEHVRAKKRRDAFAAWKEDKKRFSKPVKVELEFANPLDLMAACADGRRDQAEIDAAKQ